MAYGLFITSRRHAFAAGRAGDGAGPRARRSRARVPARADLLRTDALQRRPRGRGTELVRRFVEVFDGYEASLRRPAPALRMSGHMSRSWCQTIEACRIGRGALRVPARAGAGRLRLLLSRLARVPPDLSFAAPAQVGDGPVSLLRAVAEVEVVELPDAEECCGFGGTFAVKNADVSSAMLDAKLEASLRAAPMPSAPATPRACCTSAGGCAAGDRPYGSSIRRGARAVTQADGSATGAVSGGGPGRPWASGRCGRTSPRDDHDSCQEGAGGRRAAGLGGRRDAGAAIKDHALLSLEPLLIGLDAAVTGRGGVVHWARDAAEANAVVTEIVQAEGVDEIVKVKSLTTDEIGLNDALEAAGISLETDLAELSCSWRERALAPSRACDPQEQDPEYRGPVPRPARGLRPLRRSRQADGRRARVPSRRLPPHARGRLGRELRVRRYRGASSSSSRRETAGCARPCPTAR